MRLPPNHQYEDRLQKQFWMNPFSRVICFSLLRGQTFRVLNAAPPGEFPVEFYQKSIMMPV